MAALLNYKLKTNNMKTKNEKFYYAYLSIAVGSFEYRQFTLEAIGYQLVSEEFYNYLLIN